MGRKLYKAKSQPNPIRAFGNVFIAHAYEAIIGEKTHDGPHSSMGRVGLDVDPPP